MTRTECPHCPTGWRVLPDGTDANGEEVVVRNPIPESEYADRASQAPPALPLDATGQETCPDPEPSISERVEADRAVRLEHYGPDRNDAELVPSVRDCMCSGGGGLLHTANARCTSGPYVELLRERDELRARVAELESERADLRWALSQALQWIDAEAKEARTAPHRRDLYPAEYRDIRLWRSTLEATND